MWKVVKVNGDSMLAYLFSSAYFEKRLASQL